MSSNLYKIGYNYIPRDDKRIIDNSAAMEALEQKVGSRIEEPEAFDESQEDGFMAGLKAEEIDLLLASDEEGDSPVIKQPVYEGPSPEELIAQAELEIEQMKQAAEAEIIVEQKKVLERAKTQGYQEGYDKA